MIDKEKRIERENEEEKVKRRIQVPNMGKSYRYQPATTQQTDAQLVSQINEVVEVYCVVPTVSLERLHDGSGHFS